MPEIAGNFKAQGNDYVKAKRYREALGFYNQAIDSKPTDQALIESLLLNRAVCNLELKNYGSVLRDCSKVLSSNMTSLKALYRSALALIALERPLEAIDCCERGLLVDPESSGLISALSKAKKPQRETRRTGTSKSAKAPSSKEGRAKIKQSIKDPQHHYCIFTRWRYLQRHATRSLSRRPSKLNTSRHLSLSTILTIGYHIRIR